MARKRPERQAETQLLPERRAHGRISRAAEQVQDARGDIGSPWIVEGHLALMERRGDIGRAEREAGEVFAKLYRRAHIGGLQAADMARVTLPVGQSRREDTPGQEMARRRLWEALESLGGMSSPCGSCCWFVVGEELSLAEYARREGWGGRALRPEVAKGLLLGGLGILARHFKINA